MRIAAGLLAGLLVTDGRQRHIQAAFMQAGSTGLQGFFKKTRTREMRTEKMRARKMMMIRKAWKMRLV